MPAFFGVPVKAPVLALNLIPAGRRPGFPPRMFHLSGPTPPVAFSLALYRLPTFAVSSGFFTTASLAATVSGTSTVAVSPSVSVTWTLSGYAPATAGLPLISPVAGFNASPVGSAPSTSDQVTAGRPPVDFRASAYGTPTSPAA